MLVKIEEFSSREAAMFRKTINKLVAKNFINKNKETDKDYFYFIKKYEQIIRDYLSLAGWGLSKDRHGTYAVRTVEGHNRKKLKKHESIMLLILRMLYEEYSLSKSVSLHSDVQISIRNLIDCYLSFDFAGPKGMPPKYYIEDAIRLFKDYNLVHALESGCEPEVRLVIYPAILDAIRVTNIKQLHAMIEEYR